MGGRRKKSFSPQPRIETYSISNWREEEEKRKSVEMEEYRKKVEFCLDLKKELNEVSEEGDALELYKKAKWYCRNLCPYSRSVRLSPMTCVEKRRELDCMRSVLEELYPRIKHLL